MQTDAFQALADPTRRRIVEALSAGEQQAAFNPGGRRRVVVATNIAETSLTVPRIRYVVDTGLARISRYHPGTRSRRLPVEPISKSSAEQRRGRCGPIGVDPQPLAILIGVRRRRRA